MTTKTKHNGKPAAAGSDLLAGIPDPPEGWLPSDFSDRNGPWMQGLAQVKADGADTSGADKALRLARAPAWGGYLIGGSAHTTRQRLGNAQEHLAHVQALIVALERQGRDASEMRASLGPAERNIATLTGMIAAAEAWPGPDNVVLRQRLEEASRRHEETFARLQPYKRASLPAPPEWERDLFDVEREVTSAAAAFNAGRERLDALGDALRDASEKARMALAGSLGNVAERCGQACARIVHEADAEFLAAFPNRAPDDLLPLYARAQRVNDIMARLGAAPYAGMERFWLSCGEGAREIVAAKVAAGRNFHESGMRPREPHPDALMNQTY